MQYPIHIYAVTGTYHCSLFYAISEGEARKLFHQKYNGESIVQVTKINRQIPWAVRYAEQADLPF